MNSLIALWIPLLLWMSVIFYFSTIPQVQMEETYGYVGRGDISYLHLPVYFILSFLFLRLFIASEYKNRSFIIAVLSSTIYGACMEVMQIFIDGRFFSYLDMLLNFAGSCLVIIFMKRTLLLDNRLKINS